MFRGATRKDLPQILKIYAHAREVMKASGNPTQWGDHFPPEEQLAEDIDANRLFLYLVNGQLEGVFAFILGPDPTYRTITDGQWPPPSSPGAWSTARASGPTPTPTIRLCSTCWRKTALPGAASSGWRTAPPASLISGCP